MADVKLDHIAFGVPDVAPVAKLLVGELGGRERGAGPGAGFRFWQWEFAGGGTVEILEPDGPRDGFLYRFLAARGAGPHHVTLKFPDIQTALGRARELGYDPVGFDDSSPSWIEAFLHPKQAQGIVVQVVESHPELESEPGPGQRLPYPASPEPAEPVRVLGLRLAARSAERARRQWETLLGGERRPHPEGGEVFRWPDSPLRIRVVEEPDAPEGPRALEIAAGHPVALPEGPHPVLGLPIVQVKEEAV